jgi:adenosylmethionine-8-amino-7-oxononanoate aminotransferase
MFFHSSSYTANPIACAAAAANLEIWRTESVIGRIAALAAAQKQCLQGLRGDPHFANARQIGTITAVELTGGAGGYLDNVALSLRSKLLANGVLLRPLGNTVYVMPPYYATAEELKSVYQKLAEAVAEVST